LTTSNSTLCAKISLAAAKTNENEDFYALSVWKSYTSNSVTSWHLPGTPRVARLPRHIVVDILY
jgi:hypothetical protein